METPMSTPDALLPTAPPVASRRPVTPHVCFVTPKPCIRTFLATAFSEFGFATHESSGGELSLPAASPPDLVVIMPSPEDSGIAPLSTLAAAKFDGMVMLINGGGSGAIDTAHRHGEQLGLSMLPVLPTPFRAEELATRLAPLRLSRPLCVKKALGNGWLELWYQSKVDAHALVGRGREALCRLRHPVWGIVPPAFFIPADGDPHVVEFSEFVVTRAMEDWRYFAENAVATEIAVNLPMAVLESPGFGEFLGRQLPSHPAFGGLVIEINGAEIIRDLARAREVAAWLGSRNIRISIDDVGAEWSALAELQDLPVTEIKVDRKFVRDCADNRLKQVMCGAILDVARRFGARTVAEGVETPADLRAVRQLGFDLVQGFLFAEAMEPRGFARMLPDRYVDVLQ
jgi:EAL domain-containing protein (putative c-di-GMP-specific phosphodiesterase class I)